MIRLFKLLNVALILALLLAYAAQYVSPNKFWWLLLFGHSQFYWLLANALMVLFWIFVKRSKWFLASFMIILVGYPLNAPLIQFNKRAKTMQENHTLRVMSYNVQLFSHKAPSNINRQALIEAVFNISKEVAPHVLGFQEFTNPKRSIKYTGLDYHITLSQDFEKRLGLKYHFFHPLSGIATNANKGNGIAIFSAYPIVNKGVVNYFSTSKAINACIFADIKLPNNDTIRVFNLHYNSNLLSKTDYYYIENLGEDKLSNSSKGLLTILKKLKNSSKIRSNQADLVAKAIAKSPYKVIVMGDFNDPPSSYAYRKTIKGLHDTFVKKGFGMQRTYIGPYPSFRIDQILVDKSFEVLAHHCIKQEFSDHYPIWASLKLPNYPTD